MLTPRPENDLPTGCVNNEVVDETLTIFVPLDDEISVKNEDTRLVLRQIDRVDATDDQLQHVPVLLSEPNGPWGGGFAGVL